MASEKRAGVSAGAFHFGVSFAMLIRVPSPIFGILSYHNHKGLQLADHFHFSAGLITATVSIADGLDVINLSLIVSLKTLGKREKMKGG